MPCVVRLLRLKCSAQAEGDPATLRMRPNLFPHDRGYGGYSPEQNGAWFWFACLACRKGMHRATSETCNFRQRGSWVWGSFRRKRIEAPTLPPSHDRENDLYERARGDGRI